MDLDREQRFHQLLLEAFDLEPEARHAFLTAACADDRELLREIWQAVSLEDDTLGAFLELPAVDKVPDKHVDLPGGTAETHTTDPPTSLAARIRSTPGLSLFALYALLTPLLIAAAINGAATLMGSADVGFGFSLLSGKLQSIDASWSDIDNGDRLLTIAGHEVGGDPAAIRRALATIEPGPVRLRIAKGDTVIDRTGVARPYSWGPRLVTWNRVVTGSLLLIIGATAFLLRPGTTVTWLFLAFCAALGLHLLIVLALLFRPTTAIVIEYLALYLAGSSGLHLFTVFPQRLFRHSRFLALLYLPPLAAAAVTVPNYRDPAAYGLVSTTLSLGSIFTATTGALAVGLVLLQRRRARRAANTVALSRSHALLVAVLFGLALPALLGAVRWTDSPFHWAMSSFLVVVFASITAYSMVRHNSLDVDRFTAAVLGYGGTTVVLALAFGAVLVGLQSLIDQAGLVRSPLATAVVTATFFLLFQPFYRRIRRQVDRVFLRDRVEEEAVLRLLQRLADSVRTADLSVTFRAGLDTAMSLYAEHAELWSRAPQGSSFIRLASSRVTDTSPPPIAEDSALTGALSAGSGGVLGLADRALDAEAQRQLWSRELTLAAPIFALDRLDGFVALGRKRSGTAYTRRERAFLDAVASQLGIAMERAWQQSERLGPYRIVDRIGTGGMAEVFLGEKQGPGGFELQVALKRILPHLSDDPDCVTMFLDEARIAAQLQHPNIVRIYDIEKYEGTYYLAMEHIDGPSLGHLMRAMGQGVASLPKSVAAAIIVALLSALDYAHRKTDRRGRPLGLVHRDIKPANILISHQGEIKLVDFGIARAELRLHQTQPGVTRGTPAYMAPEQLPGADIGPQADLYSTAVVTYEILTGQRELPADRSFRPAPGHPLLAAPLADFFRAALAEHPEDRFASARAMKKAFLEAIRPLAPASREEVAAFISSLVIEPLATSGPRPRFKATQHTPRRDLASEVSATGRGTLAKRSRTPDVPGEDP